jgi:pimeloyl-ACP methyl ester carboxylesterase
MKIHLIHGIHASRPGGNTSRLAPFFAAYGMPVFVHSYGWLPALLARWRNDEIAARIAARIADGDVCVGHSNGAAIIQIIQERHRRLAGAALVNPALDADARLDGVGWLDVYHNGCDGVVELSRFLPFNRWGGMGRTGHAGAHPAARNIDCGNTPGLPRVCGHTALFDRENLDAWGPEIARNTLRRIGIDTGAERLP